MLQWGRGRVQDLKPVIPCHLDPLLSPGVAGGQLYSRALPRGGLAAEAIPLKVEIYNLCSSLWYSPASSYLDFQIQPLKWKNMANIQINTFFFCYDLGALNKMCLQVPR